MLAITFRVRDAEEEKLESSWYAFVLQTMHNRSRCSKGRILLASLVSLLAVILSFAFIADTVYLFDDSPAEPWCVAGKKHLGTGVLQYSKILLELVSVIFYSLGPKWNPARTYIRYCLMFFFVCCSCSIGAICIFADFYKPRGHSMLIPRILDQNVAGSFTELCHACVVSIFGLLEVFQRRCESQPHSSVP